MGRKKNLKVNFSLALDLPTDKINDKESLKEDRFIISKIQEEFNLQNKLQQFKIKIIMKQISQLKNLLKMNNQFGKH